MRKLLSKWTSRRPSMADWVELDEATAQVCDRACRSAAHRDRVRTAAYQARF